MTEWERGYRRAYADAMGEQGYLFDWQLAKHPVEFQAGYLTAKDEIEQSIEAEAEEQAVWRTHERQY